MSVISNSMLTPNLFNHLEPYQAPQSRCSVLRPTKNNLSHVSHQTSVFWPFSFQPGQRSATIWCPVLHLPIQQPWKPIRATPVTTHSVSGHQSVQTTSLLLVTYTLGVPLSSPRLYSQSSISVSHFHLSADFPAHRFASIRTSSVTTTSVSGRQPIGCSLHTQP